MNTDILEGKWKQATGSVKEFFGKLTDDDLIQIAGSKDKLLGKLQERYGYTREQAETEWGEFTREYGDVFGDIQHDMNDAADSVKNAANRAAGDVKRAMK
jgi:uncharacterized protein YjbJ (UPF0337 family)